MMLIPFLKRWSWFSSILVVSFPLGERRCFRRSKSFWEKRKKSVSLDVRLPILRILSIPFSLRIRKLKNGWIWKIILICFSFLGEILRNLNRAFFSIQSKSLCKSLYKSQCFSDQRMWEHIRILTLDLNISRSLRAVIISVLSALFQRLEENRLLFL